MEEQELELIISYIVSIAPSLTAVGSIIFAIFKLLSAFSGLRQKVDENTDIKKEVRDLTEQVRAVHKDNIKLRQENAELMTMITRVQHDVKED